MRIYLKNSIVVFLSIMMMPALAYSDSWILSKETTTNVCHVSKSTASRIGKDLSTHGTIKEACQQAKNLNDPDISDQTKCWDYGKATKDACKMEGVIMPGQSTNINKHSFMMRSLEDIKGEHQENTIAPWVIGGAPADPSEFKATLIIDGKMRCTATIVGPNVVLTAAHCVDNNATGIINFQGKESNVVCTQHPLYTTPNQCSSSDPPNTCTADIALCKSADILNGIKYEVIETNRNKLKKGMNINLIGFGCLTKGGNPSDTLYIGSTIVNVLTSESPKDFSDFFMTINGGSVQACKGDSGAGNFDDADQSTRSIVGVTSVGDQEKSTYLVQTSDTRIVTFFKDWARNNSAPICGVSLPNPTGCNH